VYIEPFGRITWGDMSVLWPAFPTIVGIALLLQWLAGGLRDHGLLIPVTILLVVGLGGFAFTLRGFPTFRILADYWPVLLILLGVIVLVRSFTRPRSV
jgi:ABC-type branched-subunit amino acid transport system permease subunit